MKSLQLEDKSVGAGFPCFIIAEAGVNHNGDIEIAKEMIDVAAEAGVDAIKFQTFNPDRLVSAEAPKADYQLDSTDENESQLEMLRHLKLSFEEYQVLHGYCRERGILFLSTPFDEESVDFLDELGVPVFKIGSGEITNRPFLEYIASKQKPIILSTGMSYLSEVDQAVRIIGRKENQQLVLLHCVSNYPADPADANLRAMSAMASAFQLPVGYSDHTLGIEVALAATALGACVIEKHFTLSHDLPGPDHRASLEPDDLTALVDGIRKVESAIGHGKKEPAPSELEVLKVARRSLVAAKNIPKDAKLTSAHLAIKRPGTGLQPAMMEHVIGRIAREDIPADSLIDMEMLK
jgi:N-acetylneuraminate synthase